jgi:hypothetical protein
MTMPRRWHVARTALASLLSFAGALQSPQETPRADAAISGVVRDGITKQPIADAVVRLGSVELREYPDDLHRQFTDTRGRFVFTDLPAGSDYVVTVSKPGYFSGGIGTTQARPDGSRRIRIADSEWVSDADVALWRPASISGTVTDERGEPVIGVFVRVVARVRIGGRERFASSSVTLTDDRGLYRIGMLRPGRYTVMVPSVSASAPIETPASTLLGTSEQALQNARDAGRPLPAGDPLVDAGDARIVVGRYPVPPPPVDGRAFTYPPAFAGGTLTASPGVTLGAGVDLTGVNVRLAPAPAIRIAGLVEGPADARAGRMLRLLPEGLETLGFGGEAGMALVAPDGSFVFANVPAGSYTIEAPLSVNQYQAGQSGFFYAPQLPRPLGQRTSSIGGIVAMAPPGVGFTDIRWSAGADTADRTYYGRTNVSASADVSDVVVRLGATATLRGRFVNEDVSAAAAPVPVRSASLETATGDPLIGIARSVSPRLVPENEFAITGILPGRYVIRGSAINWITKSITVNGRDHTHTPIDIEPGTDVTGVVVTFTNAVPSLTGTARLPSGAAAAEAAVVVFPAEPEQWRDPGLNPGRMRTAFTSTAGAFRIRTLPAGDYLVAAVSIEHVDAWQQPEFFARVRSAATPVTIRWGEARTVDVRVVEIP